MIYRILRALIFIALHVYFRRIYIYHRERIPQGRPLIFAGNHPSAFMDALLPISHLRQVFYFLVRGDIYANSFVKKLLIALNTLPIYRFRDGFAGMRDNQETFSRCYRILGRGKNPVLLMAEGGNSERKRLLPLQKGVARLAFGAYEETGREDIAIVPFGVNYTDVQRFRTTAMVDFGAPLYLENYLALHREDPRRAVTELTRDLERSMRRLVVQIDRAEDEEWANPWLDMLREGEGREGALEREFARVARINAMTEEERAAARAELASYTPPKKARHPLWKVVLFALVWLINAPPLLFTHWLIRRLVPSPVFFPSIRVTAGIFITLGYWIALCVLYWPLVVFAPLGYLSLRYY